MLSGKLTRALALLWCVSLSCAALRAQPAVEPKGFIQGRVTNALSGEGLRKVTLTLTATRGKSTSLTAQTDDTGRFAFPDLAGGSYRLRGERSGFQRQEYANGAVLTLAPGQEIKDLSLKLPPSAILSGRVLDQEGEPMPNLVVSAARNGYVRGKKDWIPSGGTQTNDRGEFRIASLRAGRYQVCASNLNIGIGLAGISKDALADKPDSTYAYTCAGPVEVRMGEDRRGTDIQMVKAATVRVKGRVAGAPDGKILIVMAVRKGAGNAGRVPGSFGLVQQADSTFELRGLTPGSYLLTVRSPTEMTAAMAALRPLEVGESHIEGVELTLGGGGTLSGRITSSPDRPAGANRPSVALEWVDFSLPDSPSAIAGDDGKFTLNGVFSGRYRVRVDNLPEDVYVKSVKLAGQEVDEAGVDLSPGEALEISLSGSGAQVEGKILAAGDKPATGALVALIPESARQSWYRSATAGNDGAFRIEGVPPGRYRALAWTEIEPGAFRDPEFVKPFENQAQDITLEPNGQSKLTLKAIEVHQ